ncbi:hypothetical protein ACH4NF_07995 [Streptomyces sp. NPDC017248]|uniref:hypothetical protein n=1 Tax=unclassified Streptomyces TaxID=2593676 RepID=UPI0037943F72
MTGIGVEAGAQAARSRALAVLRVRGRALAVALLPAGAAVILLAGGSTGHLTGPGWDAARWAVGGCAVLVLLAAAAVALVVARARPAMSPTVPVAEESAPDLYRMVRDLADRLDVPVPSAIALTPDCDSWLEDRAHSAHGPPARPTPDEPASQGRRRAPTAPVLVIGSPFLWWMRVGELRAVLAPVIAGTGPSAHPDIAAARRFVRGLDAAVAVASAPGRRAPLRVLCAALGWVVRLLLRGCQEHATQMERGVAAAAAERAQAVDYGLRIVAQEQVGLAYAGWDRLLTRVALPAWRMGRWPSRLDAGVVAALTELSRRDRLAEGFASRLGERPACDLLEEPGVVDEATSLLAAHLFHGGPAESCADWAPVDWQAYPEEVVDRTWRADAARLHRALDALGVRPSHAPGPTAPTLSRVLDHLTTHPVPDAGPPPREPAPTPDPETHPAAPPVQPADTLDLPSDDVHPTNPEPHPATAPTTAPCEPSAGSAPGESVRQTASGGAPAQPVSGGSSVQSARETTSGEPAVPPVPGEPSAGSAPGESVRQPASGGAPAQPASGEAAAQPAPGGAPARPVSGGSSVQPARGTTTGEPAVPSAPGESSAGSAPDESVRQPASGGAPARPAPGGAAAQPAPGEAPARPVSGGSSVQPARETTTGEPAVPPVPGEPSAGSAPGGEPPAQPAPGGSPAHSAPQPAPGAAPPSPGSETLGEGGVPRPGVSAFDVATRTGDAEGPGMDACGDAGAESADTAGTDRGTTLAARLSAELAREEARVRKGKGAGVSPAGQTPGNPPWNACDCGLPGLSPFPLQPQRTARELLADHVTAMVCCAAVDTAGAVPALDWLDGPSLLLGGERAADLTPRVLRLIEEGDPGPLRDWLAASGIRPEKPVRLV